MDDLTEIRQRIETAHTEICEIAEQGTNRWRMHIPAEPDRDSDLVISRALKDAEELADEVERLRSQFGDEQERARQAEQGEFTAENRTKRAEAERDALNAQVAVLQQALADRGDDVLAFQRACGTHLPEQAAKLRAERDALKAATDRVRALHTQGVMPDMCKECNHVPAADCPTLRALDATDTTGETP